MAYVTGLTQDERAFGSKKSAVFTATANQTVFNLNFDIVPGTNVVQVFINGVKQAAGAYVESARKITLSEGVQAGDLVEIIADVVEYINTSDSNIKTADTVIGFDPNGYSDGDVIYFKGRDSIGDGAGGVFKYLVSSVESVDDGIVFAPAEGGRLIRHISNTSCAIAAWWGVKGDDSHNDTVSLLNAIHYTPNKWVLFLRGTVGDIFLTDGISVVRSDITIIGARKPRPNGANTALEGGTIIRGTFLIDGDNVTLENFGADHGIAYSNAYKAGLGGDGLVVHKIGLDGIRRNVHVRNVVGMCRVGDYSDPQAAYHAVLLEGLENGSSDNVTGIGGWYGVVLKVANWTFDGLTGRENDTASVYIKSNSYAPCANVTGTNVNAIAGASRAYCGLLVQASDAELANVTVNGVTMIGGGAGASVRIEGEVSQPAVGVIVTGVTTRSTVAGASFRGPVYASRIEGVIDKPSSGIGLEVATNTVGTQPNDVAANVRINADLAQAAANHVNITANNSKVFLERAHVTVGYGLPGNLLVTANTQIGDVFGKLSCDLTEANLLNGWETFGAGQKCGTLTRNGVTTGYGRIKFTSATSDVFMTLPAGAYPDNVLQIVSMMGLDGITNKPTPIAVQITATGECSIFPNRAAYSTNLAYIDLSSLRIISQLKGVSGGI